MKILENLEFSCFEYTIIINLSSEEDKVTVAWILLKPGLY